MLAPMRKSIAVLGLIALSTVALAESDLGARIDQLLHRWTRGDAAARTGVAAETRALGDEAIGELYRRLAWRNWDFPAPTLGARISDSNEAPQAGPVVNVEVKFATPEKGAELPKGQTLLPADIAARLIENGDVISAPRLTVYNGQRANVSVVKQHSYARTYDRAGVEVQGVAREGDVLEMRPHVLDGGQRISLELRWERSELVGDVASVETREGSIGAPTTLKREFAITLIVDSGKPVTLAIPGGRPMLLMVTATAVELR